MPNWKKVIVSGSDALLNEITSSRGIKSTDVTIDDWGSVSASLASLDASIYGDSDVTDHINSLDVHSGSHLGTADTDDLSEGSTNLYYTDTRVNTKLNTEGVISGSSQVDINSTSGTLTTLGTVTSGDVSAILPSGVISGSISSPSQGTITLNGNNIDLGVQVGDSPTFTDLTLTGNLTVEGTRTELQVTELNVEDKNITVASGAADSAAADGAGLTIAGANESLTWNHANSRFEFSDDLRVGGLLNIDSVSNAGTDTDKFLVLDSNGNVDYRTGNEVLSDIGGSGASNLSGAATEIPFFSSTSAITSSVRLKLNKNITTGDVLVHHGQFNVINDPSVSGTAAMQIIVGSGSSGDVSNPQYDSFLSMEQESATQVGLRANGTAPTSAQIKMRTDVNDAYSIGRLTNPYGANTLRIKPAIIAEGGLSITGSLTISGSNTLKNIGPAEFSGSVKIKTSNQVQASTDTDKFVVLDGQELKYRSGTQVYDDIGVTSLSSSIAADIAALDTSAGGGTIYTSNGNLTGDRAISGVGGSHSLSFNSLEFFAINNASAISLEGSAIYLSSLPTATGSALNNSLYLDSITGEVKYASAATLSSITANGASTTNTIRAGGLLVTGSVTISGSNTLINQGPAEFSGSVSINTTDQVQASTDTDKFLVLDGDQIKYRTGTEVYDDIGVTSLSSSIAADIAGISGGVITPIQLTVDTKNLSNGLVPWSALSDLQPNANRAYTTWIAPTSGYLEKVIVSPEQTNTTAAIARLQFIENGTTTETISVTMGAAGTNKTFTFTPATTAFSAGDRLSLNWDKITNTADLYNLMVVFRLSN